MLSVPFLSLREATRELKKEIDDAVQRVLSSGNYIGGPEVEAFEAEFAAYVGAEYCIGVGNGLDAITLSLMAHGVRRGDKVLVPSNTFIATWFGASNLGAVPVPVEPDWATHILTPESVAAAMGPDVRACVPVHLYGCPVDMAELKRLCTDGGTVLIDDAAQAHGAAIDGVRVGGFGNTTTWSFYPGKNLGALGDAGAVTTSDPAIADRLRLLRNYGSRVKYLHDMIGFNTRLDSIQAAILRVKLRRLDEWNARRARFAVLYEQGLLGVGDLRLPLVPPGRKHVFHLYVVRTQRRDELRHFLEERGVATLIHYPVPPHLQSAYRDAVRPSGGLIASEQVASEVLSLPIGPHLSIDQCRQVVDSIRAFFGVAAL